MTPDPRTTAVAEPAEPATTVSPAQPTAPATATSQAAPTAPLLRIQEVAAETGLTARSIRYYEEIGLLRPAARSQGAYRLYDPSDLERLAFIRELRDDAGFSLGEIGLLLEDEDARIRDRERFAATGDPEERKAILRGLIERVDRQVAHPGSKDRPAPRDGRPNDRAARPPARPPRRTGRRAEGAPTGGSAPRGRAVTFRSLADSATLRAFQHRNYRLFFAGQAVSLVGSWMQAVAQSWLVLTLTNDPLILGVVAAAQWTPVLIFGLFGGLIADALPKRQTLIVLEASLAGLALILGILTAFNIAEVWMILVLAVLFGCVNAIEMPVRQSFAVDMVGREDVVNAVALNSALFNAARVLGPAIAGITIELSGTAAAFLINAASFGAVIVGLLAMRDRESARPGARSFARRPPGPSSGASAKGSRTFGVPRSSSSPWSWSGRLRRSASTSRSRSRRSPR